MPLISVVKAKAGTKRQLENGPCRPRRHARLPSVAKLDAMKILRPMRLTGALVILLALALLLILLLFATESALNVWARLREAPAWVAVAWLTVVTLLAAAGLLLAWRLVFGGKRRKAPSLRRPLDENALNKRLERARSAGVAVDEAAAEMAERQHRLKEGAVYVAFFGQVSTGKSALIRALAPEARTPSDPRGGTTREVVHFEWVTPAGDRIRLADVPGSDEAAGDLDEVARAEALRAHSVVYVCDGDLSASQRRALTELLSFEKPLVVALNKMDRYEPGELDLILERIRQRLDDSADVVAVQADGGSPPRVEALADAVQRCLDRNRSALERLRDSAVFRLADERLSEAETAHRARESERIVRRYSRRAVVGALAAVTPGSDLVIQGALGAAMLKELATLHEVPVRQLDLDRFLELAGSRLRKTTSIVLAVAGNGLKAFPGVGTVTGGLMHAVAYGMIFESLGQAAARTMATRGELRPLPAAQAFEDDLRESLSTRAQNVAAVALEEARKR